MILALADALSEAGKLTACEWAASGSLTKPTLDAFTNAIGAYDKARRETYPWAVTFADPTGKAGTRVEVLERFSTRAEAEDYLGTSAGVDSDKLEAGWYGVDGPEDDIEPPAGEDIDPDPKDAREDLDTIRAEVHSDDRVIEAQFNALPWFEQASDEEIKALAKCDWGGDYPADEVAQHMADLDPNVRKVFDYVALRVSEGFECHVNEDDARAWLTAYRPGLLS